MIVNYDCKTFIAQATVHFLSNGNLTHALLGALASSQRFMLVALTLHEMTKLMSKNCQLSFK